MPEQAATASLTRHAVFSPLASVREAATDSLKLRSPHDYIPALLGALAMPIESTHRVVTDTDGSVHYFHSLYREGPLADWSFEGRFSAMQHDLQGPTLVTIDDQIRGEVTSERFGAANNPRVRAEMASIAQTNQRQLGAQATSAERQIAAANRATEAANALVDSGAHGDHGRRFRRQSAGLVGLVAALQRVFKRRGATSPRTALRGFHASLLSSAFGKDSVRPAGGRPSGPKPQGQKFTYGQSGRREVRFAEGSLHSGPSRLFCRRNACLDSHRTAIHRVARNWRFSPGAECRDGGASL